MDIGYGHTRRSGRSGTKAPALLLSARQEPSKGLLQPAAGERYQTRSGAGGVGSGIVAGYVAPHSPAHGLFQSQFAATAFSDNGVRVSFKADGGAKQTFAIRGHLVDLMDDAEENDEGSKWSVLGDFFRASDLR